MGFSKEKTKDYFLLDTSVENMFINEYMVSADGDYVKVYLFALMYVGLGVELSNEDIAKHLAMNIEDVLKAWTYWENMGVIRKIRKPENSMLEYDVEFIFLKDMLYGKHEERAVGTPDNSINSQMSKKEYRDMFDRVEKTAGRVISGSEMNEIFSWINDFDILPEVVAFAFEYCDKKKRTVRYVEAVIRNWVNDGCRTLDEIKEHIAEQGEKADNYRRIFKALGFRREPTEEEKRIMNTWFSSMGFGIETVLDACSKTAGISSPNINYVNKVLENWHGEGRATRNDGELTTSEKMQYYELLREKETREAEGRLKQVYAKVPRVQQIDEKESELGRQLTMLIISDRIDKKDAIDKIKDERDTLSMERACLLTDNGFEMDYTDIKYQCEECKDTGMLDTGERCQCFKTITADKMKVLTKTK